MKKALIITYYWPPAGGPGVQRWLKFVTYLKEFNIEPIVYIPKNPTYPIQDSNIKNEIPRDVKIITQPIFEPYGFASKFSKKNTSTISKGIIPEQKKQHWKDKLLLWIRGNFFIPDARKFWIKPSIKFLTSYIEKHSIDTIITTGPPHSIHLIGLGLKEKHTLKWIADFRDPWTTIGYHQKLKLSDWSKKRHLKFEKQVLDTSDQLIVTSWGTLKEFETKTNTPIQVITNGFEETKALKIALDQKFTLSHIGSLLSERNPKNLWLALSELVKENNDFAQQFQLKLAGVVSKAIIDSIYDAKLKDHLTILGYISHTEALRLQQQSQLLLLIEIDSEITKAIIPGKLFEYLKAQRPILGIGPKNADFSTIIKETNSGTFFLYEEKEALKSQILKYFNRYLENDLNVNSKNIQKYTRKSLTEQLSILIHK